MKILVETSTVGEDVAIPYRRVTGSFVQFMGADGYPLGPWWAYCPVCIVTGERSDPLDLPEVQAAYQSLIQE